MNDPFAMLYRSRPEQGDAFTRRGLPYDPPQTFTYAVPALVCTAVAAEDSDGQSCEVYETRMPARFFRLVVLPRGAKHGFTLRTGSGMELFAARFARDVAAGMIGLENSPETS